MSPSHYHEVVLAKRPETYITDETLKLETKPFNLKPGTEEALVRVDYMSLDPGTRLSFDDIPSYIPPLQIGERMGGTGLGTVVEAGQSSEYSVGDVVTGTYGMRDYAVMKDEELMKVSLPPTVDPLDTLGPLGLTGLTAYFGLFDIGKIKAGETLVVSGAAGATGSMACQIGKIVGCKVIGITGSSEKCEWLEKEIGVDKALNYKSANFKKEFEQAVGAIDVYFDNVGGEILDLALTCLNMKARVVGCGTLTQYNGDSSTGIKNYVFLIKKRAKMEGFIVFDYMDQFTTAYDDITKWIDEGKIRPRYTKIKGLSKVVEGMNMLFTGGNIGKLVIQVHEN